MRAFMAQVPPEILALRKLTGADRNDEMWEGVLHMVAAPNREHQDLRGALEAYLRLRWSRPRGCKVYSEINVCPPGGWPNDYRIPDLVLLTPERFSIDLNERLEGAPEVVVEIRSPGDESYDKLDYYAALGAPEVWVIHRDTKNPKVFRLSWTVYELLQPADDGWIRSRSTPIELRQGEMGKMSIRLVDEPESQEDLPD